MRPGRTAGRTELADDGARAHRVADRDVDLRQMAVAGRQAVAVIDLHHLAVTAACTGDRHYAGGGGANGIAGIAAEIDPGMHRRFMDKRIGANPKWRTLVDVADDRFAQWYFQKRCAQ